MAGTILLALAPVFFVMALGYAAGRFHIVDNRNVDGLNTLVMSFALPAALFVATASAPRDEILRQAPLFAIFGGVMLVVYLAWSSLFARKASKEDASVQALTIAFPNLAGVGLPIAASVLGPPGTVPIAIALAAGSIIVSPLTLILLELKSGARQGAIGAPRPRLLAALRRALTKPVVLAPALGIVASLANVPFGRIPKACLMLIGAAAPGGALFLTGLVLSGQTFRLDWRVVSATALGDIVRPLLMAAVVLVLPIAPPLAKMAILLAAVPSGFFGILFAVNYRLDSAAAGSMVIASTILSAVTMAIAIAVLFP